MAWLNVWHRADAIRAVDEIITCDGCTFEEYDRVLTILERELGANSDGIRIAIESLTSEVKPEWTQKTKN